MVVQVADSNSYRSMVDVGSSWILDAMRPGYETVTILHCEALRGLGHQHLVDNLDNEDIASILGGLIKEGSIHLAKEWHNALFPWSVFAFTLEEDDERTSFNIRFHSSELAGYKVAMGG